VRYSSLIILLVFLAMSALSACASNELDQGAADTRADGGSTGDVSSEDAPSEDAQSDIVDAREDTTPAPFCTPVENTCADENTTRICAPDGSEFIEEACANDQECADAACVPRQICTPGEQECYDATSLMTCRPTGTAWRTETCATGTSCVDGACLSGAPNGTPCAENNDCAHGLCHCGSEDSCDPVGGIAVTPYCSASCTPGSCGSGEICVSATDFPAAGQNHCAPVCNQVCALDGMTCASVPTRDSGALTFEQACVPEGVVDIGKECSAANADACAGGTCLLDHFRVGLCTSECDGDCPNGSACIELVAGSGEHYCTPICGDGSAGGSGACPLGEHGGFNEIACSIKTVYNSNPVQNLRVCFKNGGT